MLRPIFALSSILAVAAALPIRDGSITIGPEARNHVLNHAVQTEDTGVCYYPPGSTISCPSKAQKITGDNDNGKGTGIVLQNLDFQTRSFFVYKNNCDCMPVKYITLDPGEQQFIAFERGFQGRIVRGTSSANLDGKSHALGTWMEFSWDVDDGEGWADVSLIKGCDGAVEVKALDPSTTIMATRTSARQMDGSSSSSGLGGREPWYSATGN